MTETRGQKLYQARKTFEGTQYESTINGLTVAYCADNKVEFDRLFETLPTNIQLLDNILEKIRGKKVFNTLKKTVAESVDDNTDSLVGVSSLMTHVAIECKTNREYRALLPDLHSKLGALICKI